MSDDLVKRLRDDSGDWLTDLAADRIEELTKVLEEVDAWVDDLATYADFEAEPAPVFKRVKAVLGRGYK